MSGTQKKCGEGYLVEDAGIAESMFSDYTKRGYRGIYIFAGSPHFFPKKALFIVMDGRPLKETAEKIMRILQEERAIILLDGNFLYVEDQNEALKFLCLIKDYVFVNGSCMILFLKSNLERWHGFLERELVKIG